MHPYEYKQINFFEELKDNYAKLWNSLGIDESPDLLEIIEEAKHSDRRFNLQLTLSNVKQLQKVDSNSNDKLKKKTKRNGRVILSSEEERIDTLLSTLLPDYVGIVILGDYYKYNRLKYSSKKPDTVTTWAREEVYTYLLGLYDPSQDNIVSPQ